MTTALVKSVAAKALVNAKEKGQQAFQNTNVQKALGVVILGTGAYFLGRKLWRDWQSKHQEKLTSTSIHSQQALQIYNATRWNKKNPQLLLNMVRQGIDAKNVDKAYSKLYGHTMYDDIRKTLSQDQLAVFMNAINNTPSVAKDTPPATTSEFINTSMAGKAVRFKNSAKVWKDIDGIPHAVKKVEAGSILKNTTTGVRITSYNVCYTKLLRKVGGGVKKVAKAVVRFNPVSLAAKGGVLLLVGKNFRGIADKMQYGLLSRSEAEKLNLDMAAWEQHKAAYATAVKLYSTILQGDKNKLDEAIKKGRKKPINGLGSVAVVASSAAAATPFIVKMFNFFKGLKSPEKAALIAEHGKKEGKALYKAQKKANGGGILKNLLNKQLAPQSTVPANSSEDEAMDESLAPGVDTSKSSFMAPVVTWAKNNKLLVGGIVVAGTILAVPTLRNGVAGIFTGKGKGKSKSPQARSLGSTPHKKKTVRKSKMKKTFKIH